MTDEVNSYTEGIRLSAEHTESLTLEADLFRNRARTGLSLCFYDGAGSDALRSVALLPSANERLAELNTKALFRAVTAAYSLGDYEDVKTSLGRLRELTPNDEAAAALGKKLAMRLREQVRGSYNFHQIRKSAESSGNVNVASFLLKTELRPAPVMV
jgi:DNA-binding SARP family transcriptional activator